MSLDEIVQYVDEQSIRGDLAREFTGIISDYQNGSLSVEDKEALINEVLASFEAHGLAEDEVMWRWAVSAASIAVSVV
ncbi:hypothetical protein EBS02_05865 [bacterium]|nr:hypothetical protein [bacterium]